MSKNKRANKYFEFKDPFYALIRATNEEEAITIYTNEIVGESEENEVYKTEEISKHTALGKFAECISYEGNDEYTLSDLIREFEEPNNYILLVDGELV